MEKKYITPEMEICVLDCADVITTSTVEDETDMVPFSF